jgi:hypothetical protein
MRKFNNPLADGGAPVYNTELNGVLNTEFWDVIQDSMLALTTPIAGMIVSGGLINDLGATFDIASGIAFVDGEFCRFEAVAGLTSPAYIGKQAPVVEQIEFADTVDRDYIDDTKALVTQANPGGQVIILVNPTNEFMYLSSYIVKRDQLNAVTDARTNELNSRPRLVASVTAAGALTVSYSSGGAWLVSHILDGIYVFSLNGNTVPSNHVILTPRNTIHQTSNWDISGGGRATFHDSITGLPQDTAFTIVIYNG